MPQTDPWAFHLETLRHFDPKWIPNNYVEAFALFKDAVDSGAGRLPELIATRAEALPRIREVVRQGEEIERMNAFHGMFSVSNYRSVIENFIDLPVLQTLALVETGELDRAIATLNDTAPVIENREGDWHTRHALIAFGRAVTHAQRAQALGDEREPDLALDYLLASAQQMVDEGIVDWKQIKGDDFAVIANREEYRDLIRGR